MNKFNPLSFLQLIQRIQEEYNTRKSVFQIPEKYFFKPDQHKNYVSQFRNSIVTTPLGPAAGPHTQMTQNIISAWLVGARVIELKTIQIMDDLKIDRPCIDVSNVCFNVEWSQELAIPQSIQEYVKAWYIIEMLRTSHFAGIQDNQRPVFDLSVGYDLKGIQSDKVMHFLNTMKDAHEIIEQLRNELPNELANWKELNVPSNISSGVTLSTFHGCPPEEIEKIAVYLMETVGLDTVIKLNPALLGYQQVTELLRDTLGYHELNIPKDAFQKDLQFDRAIQIVTKLSKVAQNCGRKFGVKFNNTLVSTNQGKRFTSDAMYMSGRPLHLIAMTLVNKFRAIFGDSLPISFSAGIDAENFSKAVASNLTPITLCTDMLRPGGYSRVARYWENLDNQMEKANANNRNEFILNKYPEHGKTAFLNTINEVKQGSFHCSLPENFTASLEALLQNNVLPAQAFQQACTENNIAVDQVAEFYNKVVAHAGMLNSASHLEEELTNPRYTSFENTRMNPKVNAQGKRFDCVGAPCIQACPLHVNIPKYVDLIQKGQLEEAFLTITKDNPLPGICGRVCNHPCESVCKQRHYDHSVGIRTLKRVASDWAQSNNKDTFASKKIKHNEKIAIIGSGPAGLTVAHYLALQGYQSTIFEADEQPGGLLRYAIPAFRLPKDIVDKEIARITAEGVEIRCNSAIAKDSTTIQNLLEQGYSAIFIAIGAYRSKSMNIPGENAPECIDCLTYLHNVATNKPMNLGKRIAIIGGGNAAMDAARVAKRQSNGEVYVIYRRSRTQMPAEHEEIAELANEGIQIYELTMPVAIHTNEEGHITSLECQKTRLDKIGADGRISSVPVEGSNYQIPVDSVIVAISQEPNTEQLYENLSIQHSRHGNIIVDDTTCQTAEAHIYAGGDIVRGASTIVEAMADGKRAATVIAQHLQGQKVNADVVHESYERNYEARTPWKNSVQHAMQLENEARNNFDEVEKVLTEEQATTEANRCLQCDLQCNTCVEVCPNRANFTIEVPTEETPYVILGYRSGDIIPVSHGVYTVKKRHQIVNLAEICNECGNCDNFCPEVGGPYKVKNAFFTSLEALKEDERDGYYVQRNDKEVQVWTRYHNEIHQMIWNKETDEAILKNAMICVKLRYSDATVLETMAIIPQETATLSLEVFHNIRTLLAGIQDISWL